MSDICELLDKCRSCLDNKGSVLITSEDPTLSHMLFTCTSIKVYPEVKGPQMMCVTCVQKLYNAYLFRDQCLRSESRLQLCQEDTKLEETPLPLIKTQESDEWLNLEDNDLYDDGIFLKFNKKPDSKNKTVINENNIDVNSSQKHDETSKIKAIDGQKTSRKNKSKRTKNSENGFEEIADDNNKINTIFHEDNKNISQNTFTAKVKQKNNKNICFICDICGHSVQKKWDLITHMRKHTGERPYQCNICHKRFVYLGGLHTHIQQHSGTKRFVCEECGAGLSTKETLDAHMRIHSGEMPFSCDVCGRRFRASTNLRTHIKIHTQDKRHPCPVCNKMFYTRSDMHDHSRRHSGDRPYSCPLCPRRFTGRNNQRLHMKIHAGQKDFKCPHCTKTFVSKDAMVRHSRVHSSERAFSCDKCGKKFTHKSSLNTHRVTHSDSKDFVCEICNQKFRYSSGLHTHKKKKHNIQTCRNVIAVESNNIICEQNIT